MVNSAHITDFGICFQAQGMAGTGGGRLFAALREHNAVCEDVDCFGLKASASRSIPKAPRLEYKARFGNFVNCELACKSDPAFDLCSNALWMIRNCEAGDAGTGQGQEDTAGSLSGRSFDQGDQPGHVDVSNDGSEGFAFESGGVFV